MPRRAWGGEAMLAVLAIGVAASLAGRSARPAPGPRSAPEHGPVWTEEARPECVPLEALLDSGMTPDSAHCSEPLSFNSEGDLGRLASEP